MCNKGHCQVPVGSVVRGCAVGARGLLGLLGLLESPQAAETDPVPSQVLARQWHTRTAAYFRRNWGVDVVEVRPVSSGTMLAFRYKVLDPDKARALHDRRNKAYLRDDASGAVFAVPAMENIGELRSATTPEANRIYYMIFGNPQAMVKPGNRVTIVAGAFHADGMVVTP